MNIAVLNIQGEDTGKKAKLSKDIFGIEPNDHAIYLDVKSYLAAKRQGTHKAKERAEISGSTRKIKRQKGTGTARAGSIKSPVFVGGGRVFGPKPRDYSFKLNKKVKQLARKSALSYKASSKDIAVIEDFTFDAPKTKSIADLLEKLKVAEQKSLFVLPEKIKNIYLASRNIKNTKVATIDELNTYELVNSDKLIFFEGSIDKLEKLFS